MIIIIGKKNIIENMIIKANYIILSYYMYPTTSDTNIFAMATVMRVNRLMSTFEKGTFRSCTHHVIQEDR